MKIKLRISIFGMLMLLILIFGDNTAYTAIALFAAVIHELGHILAASLLNVKFKTLSITLWGARLGLSAPLYSYKKEFLLCAAGPLINLLTGTVAVFTYSKLSHLLCAEHILFFAIASFFLAALNLLPIKSFDGGRMLICTVAPTFDLYIAEKLLNILSFISVLILWGISLYLMLRVGSSLALFVFSSALFAELFLSDETFR